VKIILDTNVFISGVFFAGPPYQIIKAWRDEILKLVISEEIFEEYRRVGKLLGEQFPMVDLQPILDLVRASAQIFSVKCLPESVTDDPDDDKFLACTLACKSKMIVSGDKHLLKVNGFRGITIIKPREFVDNYLTDLDNN
jgi:putative PIN family toxin of toxin-antitoxin system